MSDSRLSDDQARALWRRAADLQAAAEHAMMQSPALQPVEHGELSIEQVTTAAEGAGIDPEFVRIAVAEQRLPDAAALGHDDWQARWLHRLTGEPHVMARERIIAAQPTAVLAAYRRVASNAAYQLMPENTIGTDPVSDAVLVYRISNSTPFGTTMNFADARVLLVTIRPHERGTTLRIRVPLFRRGFNLFVTGVFGSVAGAGGGGLLGAIATSLGATALAVAAPAVIGMAAGGAAGVVAFRGLYRSVNRQAETALDQFMQVVGVEAAGPDV